MLVVSTLPYWAETQVWITHKPQEHLCGAGRHQSGRPEPLAASLSCAGFLWAAPSQPALLEMFPCRNLSLELAALGGTWALPPCSARSRWGSSAEQGLAVPVQIQEMTALSPPLTVPEKWRKRARMPQQGGKLFPFTWELVTAMTKWLPLALSTFFPCCWSEFGRQTVHKIDV